MYKQSIQNIEVAILSLDGVILDLNRMRYNYYNRLCKQHNINLDKFEYHQQLSNMYDMYNKLPLHDIYESGILNAKIERELFQYLSYTGVSVKEGIYELIEYFHQKNIKIAIVSTHHTKNAVEYLKLANIYKKVHFIIGSDSKCLPFPSNQMLEAIRNHFQVETHHVLVVSSFSALQKAASASKMNIIHCDDFVEATKEDKLTCYKCVPNAFEVLNTLMFDKYDEETLYSSILGMNYSMSQNELDETYKKLNKKYADDQDVLDIIEQTYQHHSSHIGTHDIESDNTSKDSNTKFVFDDEEEIIEIKKEEPTKLVESKDEKSIKENSEITQKEHHISHVKQLNKEEENELSNLLKQIQKKDKSSDQDKDDFFKELVLDLNNDNDVTDTDKHEESEESLFLTILFEFISSILSSLCLLFIGIVTSVLLIPYLNKGGLISIIENVYSTYNSIVTLCFTFIFNNLHNVFKFIPTYSSYLNENPVFSSQGVEFLNMFIFNTVIIFLTKLIIVLKGRIKNDRED